MMPAKVELHPRAHIYVASHDFHQTSDSASLSIRLNSWLIERFCSAIFVMIQDIEDLKTFTTVQANSTKPAFFFVAGGP